MNDPIFKMRAKVASKAHGHVFEERFMKLSGLQLAIAYRQAIKEEKEHYDFLGELFQAGFKRLEENFKTLRMFTNPDLWVSIKQQEELKSMQEEVKAEEFGNIWDKMMQSIPSIVTVEDDRTNVGSSMPKLDKKTQEIITGFLPKKRFKPREGGKT